MRGAFGAVENSQSVAEILHNFQKIAFRTPELHIYISASSRKSLQCVVVPFWGRPAGWEEWKSLWRGGKGLFLMR